MPEPLPRLLPSTIAQHVGERAAARGLAYEREERVSDLRWEPSTSTLSGTVAGRGASPYRTRVELAEYDEHAVSRRFQAPAPGGLWRPVSSRCSCPVGRECKHVAALLHRLGELERTRQEENPAAEWRSVLRPLLGGADEEETAPKPLAIRFALEASSLEPGAPRNRRETAGPAHLEAGADLWLGMRPMTRGRGRGWIKGSLSWRTFEYRMPGGEYRRAQSEALTRVFASASAERSYASGAIENLWLNSIGSPLIWQSLAHARDTGVELLAGEGLASIELLDDADVVLDLTSPEGSKDLALRPRVSIAGEPTAHGRALGAAGVIDLEEAPGGGFAARIAPVGALLPMTLRKLLQRPAPLEVPAADREDFLAQAFPQLRAISPVTSHDGSVELPAPRPATLRLAARYTDGDRLTLEWSWRYHEPTRTLPIDRSRGERRDLDHEDEVLDRARALWPTAGSDAPERLDGTETARFSEHVLDGLQALADVEVEIVGTRHAYRELDGAPQVRVSQQQSPGKRDWFDLGFQVTVEGREIPFPTLFVALAKGQDKLLMPDRTYFSLQHPAFDALRELIREGEALGEWDPEHQPISRYQVDMWEDLEEIAESAETAAAWERSVGPLREIVAIPAPEAPVGLTAELRPYQQEGFAWLAFLFAHGLGGILADDMGLGKTVQTLALIAHARERAHADAQAQAGTRTQADTSARADDAADERPSRPFLVVAPASVLGVWRQEAERFTPGLDVRVLDRTSRSRGRALSGAIRGADIVVTSYTVLRMDEEDFARESFQGLVLDEAQFVKNRRSRTHQAAKGVDASFRLAITGTPMENSLDDLWSLFDLVAPGLLGASSGFRQRYTMPVETGEHPERIELLRSRIRPFMLRRTKELVARELPEKREQVLTVTLSPEHRALYDSVLQRERKKVLGLIDEDLDRHRFTVFRSLTLLRMMALHPAIVDEEGYADVPSSKQEALFDRLDEVIGDQHRVLLFSQFTSYLQRVAEELDRRGVPYAYLDGSTRDRDAVVREFREGEAPVFLISLKAGGFGLTLTEADYVFLLDPWWNPAAENQAVDRAHRIGQDRTVMVYRMIAEDTIEEKVLALQQRKAELFDALTDGGAAFRSAITADDIRELLG
ncbi:DEAD/DEAH box helicase [Brachybacterium sp. DNPG3]